MRRLKYIGLILLLSGALSNLPASLIPSGTLDISGTGLGAANTVLTWDSPGSALLESGCVSWSGTVDVKGAAACPGGIAGGDESLSKTQTRTFSETGLTGAGLFASAYSIVVVFNASEPDDNITLRNLVMTIYAPDSTVLFTSGAFTLQDVTGATGGTGSSGLSFKLDIAQQFAANSAAFGTNFNLLNRIGIASTAGCTLAPCDVAGQYSATGGHETIFVFAVPIPEPASFFTLGSGLILVAALLRRRLRKA